MNRTPTTIQLSATVHNGWYRVRVVGWAVPAHGPYGSIWSIDLPIQSSAQASSSEVLEQIARALLDRLGRGHTVAPELED